MDTISGSCAMPYLAASITYSNSSSTNQTNLLNQFATVLQGWLNSQVEEEGCAVWNSFTNNEILGAFNTMTTTATGFVTTPEAGPQSSIPNTFNELNFSWFKARSCIHSHSCSFFALV